MADRNKKLNVLHVTGMMNRGGAEVMLMDIYRKKSKDINFNFLINYNVSQGIKPGDFDQEIKSLGGKIYHIGAQWDIGPFKYILHFKRICKELGTPDIIHIHMNAKSGIICLAAKLVGIKKIIVHSHGILKSDFTSFKSTLSTIELTAQRFLINIFATNYWACSEPAFSSLFYKFNLKNSKKALINNSIDVRRFLSVNNADSLKLKKSYNNHGTIIGVVGRIVEGKNLLFVLEILKLLNQLNFDFVCVVVGRVDDISYMKSVEKKVSDYQLQERVIFLGLSEDIPLVMSTFDVFLSPSKKEAFGMVAVEAQAAGLPCFLSTNFPKSIDMKLNLVTFINGSNAQEWAEKILNTPNKEGMYKDKILTQFSKLGFDVIGNVARIESLYKN